MKKLIRILILILILLITFYFSIVLVPALMKMM